MGATQSNAPRTVSMDNPKPSSVIDVSDEVVQRLKRGIKNQAKENEIESTVAEQPVVATQKEARPAAKAPASTKSAPSAPTVVYNNPTPVYVQSGGTTITAADIRRQKDLELQQNDALWRQRMSQLELTLKKTNSIMEKQYTESVEDVRKRFATAAPVHQLPPCKDLKTQLIACYRAHPGETLRCDEEVANFRNCVTVNRLKKLDHEEAPKAVAVKAG